MIYIIASNIGLALMMLIIYFRYSRFRLSSSGQIRDLKKKLEEKEAEKNKVELQLAQSSKVDSDKVEALLREIDSLRKEKENEVKLRMMAEKEIEITIQKTNDIERRMEDWRIIQDAVMKDSKDATIKLGNDLYRKLNESYKVEVETNKNLIGRISKSIVDLSEKFLGTSVAQTANRAPNQAASASLHAPKPSWVSESIPLNPISNQAAGAEVRVDDPAKKLVPELVETMKANGHLVNKNYFLPANFDEKKSKLMLCEVGFVASGKLSIIDFKACRYLEEYHFLLKNKSKAEAESHLKQRLEKYLIYLTNEKYRASILKVMTTTAAKFEKNSLILVVPSKLDLQVLKEVRYYEKFIKAEIEIMDFDGVNNVVL